MGDYYYLRLNIYDENDQRKPKWIPTGLPVKGNKKKAEQLLRETILAYEQREAAFQGASNMRFSDWVRQWLKEAEKRVDQITYQGYEVNARNHILPYFDEQGTRLDSITRAVLQSYIDHKAANGRKDGKGGLSSKSIQHLRNILRLALKHAVQNGLLQENPCEGLRLPKKQRYEYSFYNEQQLEDMFEAFRDEPLYPLIRIAAVYGLRRSELLGLQWDSIDFATNRLIVRHTVVKMEACTVEKDFTKSDAGYRSFPLLDDVREMLLELKARERENRRLFGNEYVDNSYVFKWENGQMYHADYVSKKFPKLLRKYGLPHIRFHDLRHSCACLLLSLGYSLKDAQEWLGHADFRLTANTYTHHDMSRKKLITGSIAEKFSQSGRTGGRTEAN